MITFPEFIDGVLDQKIKDLYANKNNIETLTKVLNMIIEDEETTSLPNDTRQNKINRLMNNPVFYEIENYQEEYLNLNDKSWVKTKHNKIVDKRIKYVQELQISKLKLTLFNPKSDTGYFDVKLVRFKNYDIFPGNFDSDSDILSEINSSKKKNVLTITPNSFINNTPSVNKYMNLTKAKMCVFDDNNKLNIYGTNIYGATYYDTDYVTLRHPTIYPEPHHIKLTKQKNLISDFQNIPMTQPSYSFYEYQTFINKDMFESEDKWSFSHFNKNYENIYGEDLNNHILFMQGLLLSNDKEIVIKKCHSINGFLPKKVEFVQSGKTEIEIYIKNYDIDPKMLDKFIFKNTDSVDMSTYDYKPFNSYENGDMNEIKKFFKDNRLDDVKSYYSANIFDQKNVMTGQCYNEYGFLINGVHIVTGTFYDCHGYDIYGFNFYNFHRNGLSPDLNTNSDSASLKYDHDQKYDQIKISKNGYDFETETDVANERKKIFLYHDGEFHNFPQKIKEINVSVNRVPKVFPYLSKTKFDKYKLLHKNDGTHSLYDETEHDYDGYDKDGYDMDGYDKNNKDIFGSTRSFNVNDQSIKEMLEKNLKNELCNFNDTTRQYFAHVYPKNKKNLLEVGDKSNTINQIYEYLEKFKNKPKDKNPDDIFGQFFIKYSGESGMDDGGLLRDFSSIFVNNIDIFYKYSDIVFFNKNIKKDFVKKTVVIFYFLMSQIKENTKLTKLDMNISFFYIILIVINHENTDDPKFDDIIFQTLQNDNFNASETENFSESYSKIFSPENMTYEGVSANDIMNDEIEEILAKKYSENSVCDILGTIETKPKICAMKKMEIYLTQIFMQISDPRSVIDLLKSKKEYLLKSKKEEDLLILKEEVEKHFLYLKEKAKKYFVETIGESEKVKEQIDLYMEDYQKNINKYKNNLINYFNDCKTKNFKKIGLLCFKYGLFSPFSENNESDFLTVDEIISSVKKIKDELNEIITLNWSNKSGVIDDNGIEIFFMNKYDFKLSIIRFYYNYKERKKGTIFNFNGKIMVNESKMESDGKIHGSFYYDNYGNNGLKSLTYLDLFNLVTIHSLNKLFVSIRTDLNFDSTDKDLGNNITKEISNVGNGSQTSTYEEEEKKINEFHNSVVEELKSQSNENIKLFFRAITGSTVIDEVKFRYLVFGDEKYDISIHTCYKYVNISWKYYNQHRDHKVFVQNVIQTTQMMNQRGGSMNENIYFEKYITYKIKYTSHQKKYTNDQIKKIRNNMMKEYNHNIDYKMKHMKYKIKYASMKK